MLLAENPIPSHKSPHPFPSEAVSTGSVDRTGQFSKGVCEEWEASKTQNQLEASLERQQTGNLQTDLAGRDGHQDWSEEDLEPILEAIARQIQQEYRQFYGG
jgi:hypothetical protein